MNSKKLITIVSDTSPVISLASIDRLDILEKLFKKIIIPRAVWNEFTAGENELETNKLKSFFRERVADISQTNNLLPIMDLGESEAIILYK
jgi:predicted nucleic acid-binding protein